MRSFLINFLILFFASLMLCIVLFGHFHEWESSNTETWGFILGGLTLALMIYSAFFKNRKR